MSWHPDGRLMKQRVAKRPGTIFPPETLSFNSLHRQVIGKERQLVIQYKHQGFCENRQNQYCDDTRLTDNHQNCILTIP
jgi:hypothetical protein